ncbi:MAG: hypothetical protein ACK5Z2_20915 [Bacteroidota bacterium]|jgi:hypothetical protein
MPVEPLPSDKLLSQLKVLFGALLSGQVLFGAVTVFILYGSPEAVQPFSFGATTLSGLIPLAAAMLLIAGTLVPRKMLIPLRGEKDDAKLYSGYRSVCLVRWALHEAAVLICLAGTIIERQPSLFIPAAISLLVFALLFPTRDKLFAELHLGFRY